MNELNSVDRLYAFARCTLRLSSDKDGYFKLVPVEDGHEGPAERVSIHTLDVLDMQMAHEAECRKRVY